MNRIPRLERIEAAAARTPDAGRLCRCLPGPSKTWDEESPEEFGRRWANSCEDCGLPKLGAPQIAALVKVYAGSSEQRRKSNERI
jgi:hypothetical protein